jgi:hypothetical protein
MLNIQKDIYLLPFSNVYVLNVQRLCYFVGFTLICIHVDICMYLGRHSTQNISSDLDTAHSWCISGLCIQVVHYYTQGLFEIFIHYNQIRN